MLAIADNPRQVMHAFLSDFHNWLVPSKGKHHLVTDPDVGVESLVFLTLVKGTEADQGIALAYDIARLVAAPNIRLFLAPSDVVESKLQEFRKVLLIDLPLRYCCAHLL
jgi:hypothetical protein